MSLSKIIAADLLEIKAVSLSPSSPFTWASGIQSPIYTDNRVTLAYPEVRSRIEHAFADLVKEKFPEVEVIAGTATAGIPHGAIIADYLDLPFAYIRSKPKDHGAGNQIEGRVSKGQKMVLVEDLISTGGSVLEAVAAAQREGVEVLGVIAIFTYQLEKAATQFEKSQVPLYTLTDYSELIQIAQETGYVTAEELEMLKKFKDNQETWNK